ncbi:aminoacetone oxidase family FAD-binding enzyme [Candidatus Peregrinibacteria bacterium]|nr:aminoacetone oxidase family FAD-binding enzyme [Candidatus Peregrinibacteria bacterium]
MRMQYDVIVIGGGPAGMMAAGRAAECGAKVLLFEKNATLGKKLLITGGGRCNLTNAEFDEKIFLEKFKEQKKFLFSPFSRFGVKETLEFFHARKMPTKIEAEKRVFPLSDKAKSVFDVLVNYMREGNVKILTKSEVMGFQKSKKKISGVQLQSGEILKANSYILATGGKSHPETGSTGEGFRWLEEIGHTVEESDAALVPVKIREKWISELSGLSFSNAKLTVFQNQQKQKSGKGKLLFTHFGISGPLVLNMSKEIGEVLKYGEVTLSLDLMPHLDLGAVDRDLQKLFDENKNKKLKNILPSFVTPTLSSVLIDLAEIDSEKFVHSISREERRVLVRFIKELSLTVEELMGTDKAIVTSGGVILEEVDSREMKSRLFSNMYLVGDILNIDRPSGGYSLQLCWTTGFVAGMSASVSS